jgi:Uma2 family endonuclease
MATALLNPPVKLKRRLFTVDELVRMEEAGILSPEERIELIEGEICRMTPIGARHNKAVTILNLLLARLAVDGKAVASLQGPARLTPRSLPQPDVLLLDPAYLQADTHPLPEHILLLIEVSESTLRLDRTVKLSLYAKAGIREYWILNLHDNVLEVHTEPDAEAGTYGQRRIVKKGESVAPTAFPDFAIEVAAIIP